MIICVKSCETDRERGDHNIIRSTWGKDAKAMGIDVRFFIGGGNRGLDTKIVKYEPDETVINCSDDYPSLPFKTREICKWISGKVIDQMFLCDTDTFIEPRKLVHYKQYDYAGKFSWPIQTTQEYNAVDPFGNSEVHKNCYAWCSGGAGYFLSRKAASEMVLEYPTSWAEDVWVGQVITPLVQSGDLRGVHIPEGTASWHYPKLKTGKPYGPGEGWDWMKRMQEEQP